jgi:hypothetical protein
MLLQARRMPEIATRVEVLAHLPAERIGGLYNAARVPLAAATGFVGQIRSAGVRRVSATMSRTHAVRRSWRGRESGNGRAGSSATPRGKAR